jgi:hypothetical protein
MSGAPPTVAALYVDPNGVYAGLPGVEVWDEKRDARRYAGPWPVVAHPPCARWSRLAGFTEARFGYKRGEDGGCFAAALASVRRFGGVIEHPADSRAFYNFGLPIPGRAGEWTGTLLDEGWSCYIEQGRYGFPVRKATWLYAVGTELPPLRWGRVNAYGEFTWMRKPGARPRVASPRNLGRIDGWRDEWAHGYKTATSITPPAFRDVLLAMARSAAGAVDE